MINNYDKNRFVSKSTLVRLAGVSPRTFRRYLATRRPILDAMGISPKAQKLPPQAVRYICEDYCIDLPPELQAHSRDIDGTDLTDLTDFSCVPMVASDQGSSSIISYNTN